MARYDLGWADVALDQYLALTEDLQRLVDARISQLLDNPDGAGTSHDPQTDRWTTTDGAGAGLIVYVFRVGRPRLVVLRLVY